MHRFFSCPDVSFFADFFFSFLKIFQYFFLQVYANATYESFPDVCPLLNFQILEIFSCFSCSFPEKKMEENLGGKNWFDYRTALSFLPHPKNGLRSKKWTGNPLNDRMPRYTTNKTIIVNVNDIGYSGTVVPCQSDINFPNSAWWGEPAPFSFSFRKKTAFGAAHPMWGKGRSLTHESLGATCPYACTRLTPSLGL